jgi:hypothetical protein
MPPTQRARDEADVPEALSDFPGTAVLTGKDCAEIDLAATDAQPAALGDVSIATRPAGPRLDFVPQRTGQFRFPLYLDVSLNFQKEKPK